MAGAGADCSGQTIAVHAGKRVVQADRATASRGSWGADWARTGAESFRRARWWPPPPGPAWPGWRTWI